MFGAVLVSGARQVGKTTFLKNFTDQKIRYITLDDPAMLSSAKSEPSTFLKDNPPPLIIDEVQYAPELLEKANGQFFFSSSRQFHKMKNINLLGLSLREILNADFYEPFVPTMEYFAKRKDYLKELRYDEVWHIVHRGGMPAMWASGDMDWQIFYAAYTKTYLERDVRDLAQVGDELKFLRFMTVAASMTGQLLNLSSLAQDVGVSAPTAERWISILQASNIIYLLQPFHNNLIKRAIKTPKLYFLDTGLAAYLTRWNNPEVLKNGAMAGNFFENFVITEIIKSYCNAGLEPPLYFYRDKEKVEIDLLIESDGALHPIEIKKHADPRKEDFANFSVLDKITSVKRGSGGVICMYDKIARLGKDEIIIPINAI